jgi:hypothetical protein
MFSPCARRAIVGRVIAGAAEASDEARNILRLSTIYSTTFGATDRRSPQRGVSERG